MAKPGRNGQCPCGSGRKFKKCCEHKTRSRTQSRFLIIAVGGAVLAAFAAGIMSFNTDGTRSSTRVWDPAHGHYHDANGVAIP
jgi:hypothetical protein